MRAMVSQITSLKIVYTTVYSGAGQRKRQSSASLAYVQRTHRWQVVSPHKWPVMRKMFPFDNIIMMMADILVPYVASPSAAMVLNMQKNGTLSSAEKDQL